MPWAVAYGGFAQTRSECLQLYVTQELMSLTSSWLSLMDSEIVGRKMISWQAYKGGGGGGTMAQLVNPPPASARIPYACQSCPGYSAFNPALCFCLGKQQRMD